MVRVPSMCVHVRVGEQHTVSLTSVQSRRPCVQLTAASTWAGGGRIHPGGCGADSPAAAQQSGDAERVCSAQH